MKREIKFRAWDGETMLAPGDSIEFKNSVFYQLRVTTPDDRKFTDLDCKGLELMQFTGLLDKNGKEIFEGDIVKHSFKNNWKCQIIFDTEKGCWHNAIECKYSEVIGNIYENPELLK